MATVAPTVLVIEDEPQMRRFLRTSLRSHGYQVIEAGTAREGLAQAAGRHPELILLDLGLPDGDGLTVTRTLRGSGSGRAVVRTPIIVLSARGREQDKVAALDLGADDYLTKPFGVGELLARMRAAMRHAQPETDDGAPFAAGELIVDLSLRRVRRAGEEVHLTPTEYRLLAELIRHEGRVLTHRQLLEAVWGANAAAAEQTHYLRVYMGQLRHKLERDPARPKHLITEPGVGYRLMRG
jgi:two-component system KDP operon response regulator KdpE